MADIRKRTGAKGTTYQVRYPSKATKSGFAYATFSSLKEARAFRDQQRAAPVPGVVNPSIRNVDQAIDRWIEICAKEGRDGRDPVTAYTLKSYQYRADIMKTYSWAKGLTELQAPDVVAFRSWLLQNYSRDLARKVLSSFHSVLREMALRGHMAANVAAGIAIRADSRYDAPIVIPSPWEVTALLASADRLANSKNRQTAKTWERYRPILYLAADSGMRPQEYLVVPRSNLIDGGVHVTQALERGGYKISVTKTPAGRRFIDLSATTYEMVRHYADKIAPESKYDLVFPTANGRWQDTDNWRRRGFYRVCLEAGLVEEVEDELGNVQTRPKFSPYDLRHFYASMLIDRRVNLKRMQALMGHEDIKTTLNVYGHLIEKKDAAESERIGMVDHIVSNNAERENLKNSVERSTEKP